MKLFRPYQFVLLAALLASAAPLHAEDPAASNEPVPVEEAAKPESTTPNADAELAAQNKAKAEGEAAPAAAEGAVTPAPVANAETPPPAPEAGADPAVIEDYCREFASSAAEARTQHQKAELDKLKTEVSEKLKQVEEKTAALKEWISKREEITARASKDLTKIYGQMEPDAAARQMEKLDPQTAGAILRTLNAKRSSEILATMDTDKASRIIRHMADDAAKKTGSET